MVTLASKSRETRIREAARQLQPLTPCSRQLMHLAEDHSASIDDALGLIQTDAGLAAQLIRTANSSFYGLSRRISTIREAAVLLGLQGLRNVAVAAGLSSAADRCRIPMCRLDARQFNRHLLGVGIMARGLSTMIRPELADQAFLAGLMHDFGRLLMLIAFPSEYSELLDDSETEVVPLHERELARFGIHHGDVLQLVESEWRLPATLLQAVVSHHEPARTDEPLLNQLLRAADVLTKMAGVGDSGNPQREGTAIVALALQGCSPERILQLVVGLPQHVNDVTEAWGPHDNRLVGDSLAAEIRKELEAHFLSR